MRRLESPGRVPTTVTTSVLPSGVRASAKVREIWNSDRSPRWPGAASTRATRSARPMSPAEPGSREGKSRAMPCSDSGAGLTSLP